MKTLKQLSCLFIALVMVLSVSVFTFAQPDQAPYAYQFDHGIVVGFKTNDVVSLVSQPDEGYILAVLLLLEDSLPVSLEEKSFDSNGVVTFTGESTGSIDITARFRRAFISLDKKEFGLSAGECAKIDADIFYVDGNLEGRDDVRYDTLAFSSSDEQVATVDENGKITAVSQGYARITVSTKYGNVKAYCYVVVDGDKSEKVGTIALGARFSFSDLDIVGHSYIVFESAVDDLLIDTTGFFKVYVPTEAYKKALEEYDGTGNDPVSFLYATNGEAYSEELAEQCTAYADTLFETKTPEEYPVYTVNKGDIITFGNTTDEGIEMATTLLSTGDYPEVIQRNTGSTDYSELITRVLSGEIGLAELEKANDDISEEMKWDLSHGYMPINGHSINGGVCINYELYSQASMKDYKNSIMCKTDITKLELEALIDFATFNNYFSILERNCSLFAAGAWNIATSQRPELHIRGNFGGVTSGLIAPLFIQANIVEMFIKNRGDHSVSYQFGISVIQRDKNKTAQGQEEPQPQEEPQEEPTEPVEKGHGSLLKHIAKQVKSKISKLFGK